MVHKDRIGGRRRKKRPFTVALDPSDYDRLVALADSCRPRLSKRYLAELAVLGLLDQVDGDSTFKERLMTPFRTKGQDDE